MKIIIHSIYNANSIRDGLGKAEYSYYFVQATFEPILEQLGTLVHVSDPESEVDALFDECQATGEACVFLSFAPPQLVPITLRCPTIPVIAWEFTTLPCETWNDNPRNDWRVTFRHCQRVIALSGHTAQLVKDAMGDDFPVFAIPAASFDAFAHFLAAPHPFLGDRQVRISGNVFDTADEESFVWLQPTMRPANALTIDDDAEPPPEIEPPPAPAAPILPNVPAAPPRKSLRARFSITLHYLVLWYRDVIRDIIPYPLTRLISLVGRTLYRTYHLAAAPPPPVIAAAPAPPPAPEPIPLVAVWQEIAVTLQGVVYVTIFAPQDGRKNWHDLLTAFVFAFRDNPDATLVMKMPHHRSDEAFAPIELCLSRLKPHRCRVVLLFGFLDNAEYAELLQAATYYVNTSFCEGLCMPLVEFLSAGKPAIAPDHTAMADYISDELAFRLRGSLEHNVWPQDPRLMYSTMRYRMDWMSMVEAYQASFAVATAQDETYGRMAKSAQQTMRDFCSSQVVREKLAVALADFRDRETEALVPNAAREVAE